MVLRHVEDLEKYLALLRAEPAEVNALYDDILINVTEFFRDPDAFETFAKAIVPRLIQNSAKEAQRRIRIWVPGCSTGEEAYSLAIVLLEELANEAEQFDLQIFATDISDAALDKARAGMYPSAIRDNVSPERLRRFFVEGDNGYQIHKRVRELCAFARHNVAKDPPFSRLDVISCRNLLIYLGPVLQHRIIPTFHYALNPNGYLLLGSSETVGTNADLFHLIDKRHKIYQRKSVPALISLDMPVQIAPAEKPEIVRHADIVTEYDLQREADRMVLDRYAPPGVIVDQDLNILQFRGNLSAFIEPAPGVASLNLTKMLKGALAMEVKLAVTKVRRDNAITRREGIPFDMSGHTVVDLAVMPFKRSAGRDRRYLIVFEASQPKVEKGRREGKHRSQRESWLEQEHAHLRQELLNTREYLQSIIEDQEAAHEELRSAAEEIQSSNEELQSTNEELETAKEELQSTNEELHTVNEELQNRNTQLTQLGNDLMNLLANVNMPIVILGNDLRIRRFTPVAEKVLNLIPSDVGRPIRDINLPIRVPSLEATVSEVAESLAPKVMEVKDSDGRPYSLRMRPYRTEENKVDGVVLVFVDLDPVMRAAEAILPLKAYLPADAAGTGAMLLFAQEEERRRLAHELHDELNQKLALLEMTAQNISNREGVPPDIRKHLEDIRKSVGELSEDLRRIAYQLHPAILDDLGLVPAVQSYCDEFSTRERIQVRFSHSGVPAELPPAIALVSYRIVQESLRNVAKHSRAKRANVSVTCAKGAIEIVVRDGGRGFVPDRADAGLGMLGMRERVAYVGGSIEWKSKPGDGTQVCAKIPLNS